MQQQNKAPAVPRLVSNVAIYFTASLVWKYGVATVILVSDWGIVCFRVSRRKSLELLLLKTWPVLVSIMHATLIKSLQSWWPPLSRYVYLYFVQHVLCTCVPVLCYDSRYIDASCRAYFDGWSGWGNKRLRMIFDRLTFLPYEDCNSACTGNIQVYAVPYVLDTRFISCMIGATSGSWDILASPNDMVWRVTTDLEEKQSWIRPPSESCSFCSAVFWLTVQTLREKKLISLIACTNGH